MLILRVDTKYPIRIITESYLFTYISQVTNFSNPCNTHT